MDREFTLAEIQTCMEAFLPCKFGGEPKVRVCVIGRDAFGSVYTLKVNRKCDVGKHDMVESEVCANCPARQE